MGKRSGKGRASIWAASSVFILAGACNDSGFSGNSGASKETKAQGRNGDDQNSKTCGAAGSKKQALALQDDKKQPKSCNIEPSGEQARMGVYAVALTKPAPCDFKLPYVTVSEGSLLGFGGGAGLRVKVGTYWNWLGASIFKGIIPGETAHSFPLTDTPPDAPRIDNGFILVQPDNKSYLLVDAGLARPGASNYQSAADIASQLSQSLGFGSTTLLQPEPGSESDNFAKATVFKAGSVIAIYDDTPDMAGHIEVETLLTDVKPQGQESQTEVDDDKGPGADGVGPNGAETTNGVDGDGNGPEGDGGGANACP